MQVQLVDKRNRGLCVGVQKEGITCGIWGFEAFKYVSNEHYGSMHLLSYCPAVQLNYLLTECL